VTGSAERVEVAVARAIWAAGDTVIDVRTPGEYALGHLPGALNVPVDTVAFRARELPPGQVLTVCSMGNRSWRAAQILAATGREALSLTGGAKAWAAAGLPLVTGAEPGERVVRRGFWRRFTRG
jgi:rhodanese-related sulfurtransferase